MTDEELKPLTVTDLATLAEYVKTWNGTRAWMTTHPKSSYNAARASASEWLAKPNIKAAIADKLDELHMSADEAIKLHSDIARSDIGDLLDNNGLLDLREARAKGLTRLIRKIKQKTVLRIGKKEDDEDVEITEIEFEMYPADAAQDRILKLRGKYTDHVDLTTKGEAIPAATVNVYLPDNGRDKKE